MLSNVSNLQYLAKRFLLQIIFHWNLARYLHTQIKVCEPQNFFLLRMVSPTTVLFLCRSDYEYVKTYLPPLVIIQHYQKQHVRIWYRQYHLYFLQTIQFSVDIFHSQCRLGIDKLLHMQYNYLVTLLSVPHKKSNFDLRQSNNFTFDWEKGFLL